MRIPRLVNLFVSSALVGGLLAAAPAAAQAVDGAIAFVTGRGAELFEIWATDPAGTDPDPLVTGPPGTVEADPSWNPDGTELVFSRKSPGDETYDLFRKPVPTGAAVRLTDEEGRAASDREPAWSPVGGQIAFVRLARGNGASNLWRVNQDGSGLLRLTETAAPGYDASPAWSPDGGEIAFVSDRAGGIAQIFTMDAGGATEVQRTFEGCFAASPTWKPDPVRDVIAYERLCPGSLTGWDIWQVDLTTGVSQPVTNTPDHDHQPAWSPSGSELVFSRYPAGGGNKELWKLDPAAPAATQVQLTTHGAADLSPDWGTNVTIAAAGRGPAIEDAAVPSPAHEPVSAREPSRPRGKKRRPPRKVAKGVRYREMRAAKSDVYVLKVNPALIPRIDVALSNDRLPGHERTSSMAKRHGAIAAINGDFGTPSGRPAHTFAEDGDLKQIAFGVAPTFAMTQDERTVHFARPFETVTAREEDGWLVDRWNFGEPGPTQISAFTPAGGTLEAPPGNACSARLQALGERRWGPGLSGVEADFQVTEVGCGTVPFGLPATGQVVLSAQPGGDGAILLNSLSVGETVTAAWSLGFAGVLDTVGGAPLLVQNGADAVPRPCTESVCQKHPRTGIGITPGGRILLVVVDGRRDDSKGMTLVRFAAFMRSLGAVFALNLDGGGSSTMVVKGRVMNVPSDGRQRKVSSAVLVLKGRDPGEAAFPPAARGPSAAAPPPARDQAGELAAGDPASTGGLAEAMAEGAFGPRVDLPPELRSALRIFRTAN